MGEDASKFNLEIFIKVSASAVCLIRYLNGKKLFGFLLVDILGINSYSVRLMINVYVHFMCYAW